MTRKYTHSALYCFFEYVYTLNNSRFSVICDQQLQCLKIEKKYTKIFSPVWNYATKHPSRPCYAPWMVLVGSGIGINTHMKQVYWWIYIQDLQTWLTHVSEALFTVLNNTKASDCKISWQSSDLHVCSISSHGGQGATQCICFYSSFFTFHRLFSLQSGVKILSIDLCITYSITEAHKRSIWSNKRGMTYPYGAAPWLRGGRSVFVYPKSINYFDVLFGSIILKLGWYLS